MSLGQCQLCGTDVRWVMVGDSIMALDTIASVDGLYRLDGEDVERAEKMAQPGHAGFKPHRETCPKQTAGAIGR